MMNNSNNSSNSPLLSLPATTTTTTNNDNDDPLTSNDNSNLNHDNDLNYLNKYPISKKLSWLSGYDLWNLRSSIPTISTTTTISSSSSQNEGKSLRTSAITTTTPTPTTTTTTTTTTTPTTTGSSTGGSSSSSSILRMSDGPHGIRKPLNDLSLQSSYPSTCFPSACSLSNSWNTYILTNKVGCTLRDECIYYNIHILLCPGINIKRHPYGGRNHEYFSGKYIYYKHKKVPSLFLSLSFFLSLSHDHTHTQTQTLTHSLTLTHITLRYVTLRNHE
jgi:hypothetical protein